MEQFNDTIENKPIMIIGKDKISEGLIKEIKKLVKQKGMIKIKALKSAAVNTDEINDIIVEILKKTEFFLLDIRGHSFILSRRQIPDFKIKLKIQKINDMVKNS
ncbi:MAG: hypothetical protein GY870_03790 [archaeon]|nr:hypothetical protein [archaeon]